RGTSSLNDGKGFAQDRACLALLCEHLGESLRRAQGWIVAHSLLCDQGRKLVLGQRVRGVRLADLCRDGRNSDSLHEIGKFLFGSSRHSRWVLMFGETPQ